MDVLIPWLYRFFNIRYIKGVELAGDLNDHNFLIGRNNIIKPKEKYIDGHILVILTKEVERWTIEASTWNKIISYLLIIGFTLYLVWIFYFEIYTLKSIFGAFNLIILVPLLILVIVNSLKVHYSGGHIDTHGFTQRKIWKFGEIKFDEVYKFHVYSYDVLGQDTPIYITFFEDTQKLKLDLSMMDRQTAINIHEFIKNRLKDIDSEYFTLNPMIKFFQHVLIPY